MAKKKNQGLQSFRNLARKLGALNSGIVDAKTIETDSWVRLKCQFGCDMYGECLTCPPFSPTPEKTRDMIRSYKKAILIHGNDHTDISDIAVKLEKEIFLKGYYKAFAFGAGPCRLCSTCNVKNPCRNSEEARPSMEAAGIDVFKTARRNGFKINVLKDTRCKGNYFGLVLIE